MLIEIRKQGSLTAQMVIRSLQYTGRIKRYINDKGFVCYDDKEYEEYKKSVHRGRPPKKD